MADESEKRFHAVMDKLFYAPRNPKSQSNSAKSNRDSLPGAQPSRGMKRRSMSAALSKVGLKSRGSVAEQPQTSSVSGGAVQAPLCRPWDRGDLQKRLATFKSMTWFAKPKVVSAVNCARRGWINVDSDIIACEACGARLLFSTPPSWTQHQVEKAAMVFSLKLDNGHKIFCPWVDNSCAEALAEFPPMTAAVLVEQYKKRYTALLQMSVLPVISSSAIDFMKSSQLDDFLKESLNIEFINKSADASSAECPAYESQAITSTSYYQALKLVSLCGWELRLMPYFVDYEAGEDQSIKDVNLSDPSSVVYTESSPHAEGGTSDPNEDLRATCDPMASTTHHDPSSVVVDCRLCGASVGLWAFSTTPRPVEFLRLVGEVNGEQNATCHKRLNDNETGDSGTTHDLVNENHFDASENTSASDASMTGSRLTNVIPSSLNLTIAGGPSPAKQNFRPTITLPVIGRNLRTRFSYDLKPRPDDGQSNHKGDDPVRYVSGCSEQCDTLQAEKECNMLLEGPITNEQIICETDRTESHLIENTRSTTQGSIELLKTPEDSAFVKSGSGAEDLHPSQLTDSTISTTAGNVPSANNETSTNDTLMIVAVDNSNVQQSPTPGSEIVCSQVGDNQNNHGTEARIPSLDSSINKGLDMKQSPVVKRMEFDPISQHRHFCPWITSSGSSPPGWKQTLSALLRQKEFSSPSSAHSPSSSLIKVDDPITSVKKLFMSPSPKRAKHTDS